MARNRCATPTGSIPTPGQEITNMVKQRLQFWVGLDRVADGGSFSGRQRGRLYAAIEVADLKVYNDGTFEVPLPVDQTCLLDGLPVIRVVPNDGWPGDMAGRIVSTYSLADSANA